MDLNYCSVKIGRAFEQRHNDHGAALAASSAAPPIPRDAVEDKFGAVFTAINYGMWDLMPASESSCTITYAGISDPGGSVPGGAASWASEKSLPDNINSFYSAAR